MDTTGKYCEGGEKSYLEEDRRGRGDMISCAVIRILCIQHSCSPSSFPMAQYHFVNRLRCYRHIGEPETLDMTGFRNQTLI